MAKTEKVYTTGRFGSRYGVGIRKRLLKVEPYQKSLKECPNCGSFKVKRQSKGVFVCKKCKAKFVGGAYLPKTLVGSLVGQMVSLKSFTPEFLEKLSSLDKVDKEEQTATNEKGGD
ncbi:MAG: 50S ribosomal protein L37ae [Candidatus Diapherotrites archaeon]